MLLGKILGLESTQWEEGLVAMSYLAGAQIDACAFAEDVGLRLGKLSRALKQLPQTWAKELACQVLLAMDEFASEKTTCAE